MQDLIKLLPDGASAVAVIIVVMLFLKQQDRINLMLESITKGFNDQVFDSQKTFQDQILRLTRQGSTAGVMALAWGGVSTHAERDDLVCPDVVADPRVAFAGLVVTNIQTADDQHA